VKAQFRLGSSSGLICGVLVLSSILTISGCAHPGQIASNLNTAPPAGTNSQDAETVPPGPAPAATGQTQASALYNGESVPARAGEGPDDIWVINFECAPNVLTVKAGTAVTWTNLDFKIFVVVSDTGLFNGYLQAHGGTWSYTFDSPGAYGYSIDPYNDVANGMVIVD
jgi:plastocyanin